MKDLGGADVRLTPAPEPSPLLDANIWSARIEAAAAIDAAKVQADATIDAAKVQAQATIQAGKSQADASVHAAWIQGGFAGSAAVMVLIAAVIAYLAAVAPIKEDRRRRRAEIEAYKTHLLALLDSHWLRISMAYGDAVAGLRRFQQQGGSWAFPVPYYPEIDALGESDWRDHARLGADGVGAIARFRDEYRQLQSFAEEVRRDNLRCDDVVEAPGAKGPGRELPDGGIEFDPEVVVEQNFSTVKDALDRLTELLNLLGKKCDKLSDTMRP